MSKGLLSHQYIRTQHTCVSGSGSTENNMKCNVHTNNLTVCGKVKCLVVNSYGMSGKGRVKIIPENTEQMS
jgi:hypothetical protein